MTKTGNELYDIRVRLQQIVCALRGEREALNNLYEEILSAADVLSRYIPAHQQLPEPSKENDKQKAIALRVKRIRNKCELSAAQCIDTIDLLTETIDEANVK